MDGYFINPEGNLGKSLNTLSLDRIALGRPFHHRGTTNEK